MKKLLFPIVLLAAASVLPAHAEKDHTPLGKEMEALNDTYKSFRKETDPVKGAASAREAQERVLKALAFAPALLEDEKDPAAKEKAMAEYKTMMGKLYVTLCEVESAFIAKDLAKVAVLADSIKGEKKEGHGKFIKEEDH
ncbi:MAG: hypothetical protein JWO82_3877 [Akkermansiaceae bacterium]|nr:hypothetical protein [Akkermansiaceae bacterium]